MIYNKGVISVITPCYNGEKYLDRYFISIINQTYKKIEIIIVDDGSTDNTSEIIESYRTKITSLGMSLVHLNQKNSGQAVAVNNALKKVTGEFLIWADCDDYFENNAFEIMKKFLENNSFNFMRGESAFRNEDNLDEIVRYGRSKDQNNYDIFESYVLQTDAYTFAGIFMVRMKYFDKCIKDREIYCNTRAGQNWQLILPLAYYDKCGYLSQLVYNVVETKNSHSRQKRNFIKYIIRIFQLRSVLLCSIKEIQMDKKIYKYYLKKINKRYYNEYVLSPVKRVVKKILAKF